MSDKREKPPASLLSIPCEIRNELYMYVFSPDTAEQTGLHFDLLPDPPDALAVSLKLQSGAQSRTSSINERASRQLSTLLTCKRIHDEAHLLALSLTPFHVSGQSATPGNFHLQSRILSDAKLGAIRHLTLTARISHLRAMNEEWAGLPFGHSSLRLDTLVVVPRRPEVCHGLYAEISDLSQSHTLAYVLSETLKSLRNVGCVELRNQGCFNEMVWKLSYRNLVYRLWRWGGWRCGIKLHSGEEEEESGSVEEKQWYRVYLRGGEGRNEVGEEVARFVGLTGEWPDANLAGGGP